VVGLFVRPKLKSGASIVRKLDPFREIDVGTAPRDVKLFPTASVIFWRQQDKFVFILLGPVSSTLLEVNKALLSRLVNIFQSLSSHACDAPIRYANPDDFRHHLVRRGSSR
jgi:hypothetical protein